MRFPGNITADGQVAIISLAAVLALCLCSPATAGEGDSSAVDYLSQEQSLFPISAGVDSLSSGSTYRMKEMIDRETGEVQIEGTDWERKKNPRLAMLCALAVPGLGQIYNEKPIKAVIAAGVEIYYLNRILHYYRLEKREARLRDSTEKYITTGGENPVTLLNPAWRTHDLWVREYSEKQIDWVWWSAGCILLVVLDAYIDAYLHDMNFRIEGSPVEESAGLALVIDF